MKNGTTYQQHDEHVDIGTAVGLKQHALRENYPQGTTLSKGFKFAFNDVMRATVAELAELHLKAQEPQVLDGWVKVYAGPPLQRCVEFVPLQDDDGTASGPNLTRAPWATLRVKVHLDTTAELVIFVWAMIVSVMMHRGALREDGTW